jgi:hypothetical protein
VSACVRERLCVCVCVYLYVCMYVMERIGMFANTDSQSKNMLVDCCVPFEPVSVCMYVCVYVRMCQSTCVCMSWRETECLRTCMHEWRVYF